MEVELHISSGLEVVQMNEDLWGTLPEVLVDMILARLPIPRLFQMRIVCKRWNDLIHSPSFLEDHAQVHDKPSSILHSAMVWNTGIASDLSFSVCATRLFCPSSKHWYPMPLDFTSFQGICPIAVAGALLCVACYDTEDQFTLVVCNPLTRSWRQLPPWNPKRPNYRPTFTTIVVDSGKRTYRVIVIDLPALITFVYDSSTKTWSQMGKVQPRKWPRQVYAVAAQEVVCDGIMYCLVPPSGSFSNVLATHISKYDLDKGLWNSFEVQVREKQEGVTLLESCGRILLITYSTGSKHPSKIWELIPGEMKCRLIDSFPKKPRAFKQLDCSELFSCRTLEHGDALGCWLRFTTPGGEMLWIYDMTKKSWHNMSAYDWLELDELDFTHGFPIELRLDIPT